jgi:glycerophosphoryl diester phosphodiesterase
MKLIAHRGGAGLRVENTLAAFENALAVGADGAELDVHLTRDGEIVVHHDDTLDGAYCRREDGGWLGEDEQLRISDLTCSELQRYDIGTPRPESDYALRFDRISAVASQRIPLLRDVIRLVKTRSSSFVLVIEIKTPVLAAAHKPWLPLLEATLGVLEEEDFVGRSVLCSFDWGALVEARRRWAKLPLWFTTSPLSWYGQGRPPPEDLPPTSEYLERLRASHGSGDAPWYAGFDPRRFAGGYPEAIAAAGGNAWFMYYRDCTPEHVRESASHGLLAAAWSVNLRDRGALGRLVRTGADAVCLDYPDVDLAALSRSG